MFKRILVAIDNSAPASRALEAAVKLATEVQGQIAVLHVVDTTDAFVSEIGYMNQEHLARLRSAGYELLSKTFDRLPKSILAERMMVEGDPAEAILNAAAEWQASLVVIGSDSRGRLAHFLLGSTADSVIRRASCPVLSVRANALSCEAEPLPRTQPVDA